MAQGLAQGRRIIHSLQTLRVQRGMGDGRGDQADPQGARGFAAGGQKAAGELRCNQGLAGLGARRGIQQGGTVADTAGDGVDY